MIKQSIATTCLLLLALGGCGGSDTNTAARRTACVNAKAAQARYASELNAIGVRINDPAAMRRAATAAEQFRNGAKGLAGATSGADRQDAERLLAALAQQRTVLAAYAAHDRATVRKNSPGLNVALFNSFARLAKICPGIPPKIFPKP